MSFWVSRKENGGRRSLYLLGIPIELMLVLVAIIFGFVIYLLRYINAH